jgi:hypothetical protein
MVIAARSPVHMRTRTIPAWRPAASLIVLLAAVATLVAACGRGGSRHPAASSIAASASSSARQSGALYASCMRAHGVANFPDSAVSINDGHVEFNIPLSIKSEPQFQSASRACSKDLPGGGASAKPSANIQDELDFARCMRAHGITDFPDPLQGGGFNIPGDTNTPQFQAAETACQSRLGTSAAHPSANGS